MEEDEFEIPPNVTPAWPMPYVTNRKIKPTDKLPTYAGFSRSLGNRDDGLFHGSWLMRFADKNYYCMVPAVRKKGVLPVNKHGLLQTRCARGRGSKRGTGVNCPAKALLDVNPAALEKIKERNYEWLRQNPDSMVIVPKVSPPHTCEASVPWYYADRCAVTEAFRREKIECEDGAWKRIVRQFTSNLGLKIDAAITGIGPSDHRRQVDLDRSKFGTTNIGSQSATDLQVPDQNRTIHLSGQTILDFYRGCDEAGNHYFGTPEDSKVLCDNGEIFMDGTWGPIKGLKKYFEQLYIISVRIDLADGGIKVHPCMFVYMVSRDYQNYLTVFNKIREIANTDVGSHAGLHTGFYPDFIHADAEAACRRAALEIWPTAEYRYCYFHLLQAFRRRLLKVIIIIIIFRCILLYLGAWIKGRP